MMDWGMGWGGVIFGLFFLALLLAGLVALVFVLVRGASGQGQQQGSGPAPRSSDRALEILKERYARGEITKEEYDKMRRDLMDT